MLPRWTSWALAWALVAAALAVILALHRATEHDGTLPQVAMQILLPLPIAVGGWVGFACHRRSGSRAWLVPAITFLALAPGLLIGWTSYPPNPEADESCDARGFVPRGVAGPFFGYFIVGFPVIALGSIVVGAAAAWSRARRVWGAWSMLAGLSAATLWWVILHICSGA